MGCRSLRYFSRARVGRNEKLERINEAVDWHKLGKVVKEIYAAPVGRPSYPSVVMVKIMMLQQWYEASDEAIEEALWDRVSFKRFVGLGMEEDVPDHSTISRFPQGSLRTGPGPAVVEGTDAPTG